jgi:nucleoside-diphosphate-sugar epimerase
VNIGNPDEITIKDFAEEIIKLTGTTQKIIFRYRKTILYSSSQALLKQRITWLGSQSKPF